MKTLKDIQWLILGAVFFASAAIVYAYPPDNAAVLYYKAMMLYESQDKTGKMMVFYFSTSDTEPNDKIREFVNAEENQYVIDTVLDASEIKNCDWGMDLSQGQKLDSYMPVGRDLDMLSGGNLRRLAILVGADARVRAADGHYEEALSRCMSLYKMAQHINGRTFVNYLIGIIPNNLADLCMIQILGDMPQDERSLMRLKSQLIAIDGLPLAIKPVILGEREAALSLMAPGKMANVIRCMKKDYLNDKPLQEKILSFDKTMIDQSREYFEDYYAGVMAAFDMPFVEGNAALMNLERKVEKDAKTKPGAILTHVLAIQPYHIFSNLIRSRTLDNVVRAAIEIYLIKAKTGKLPDVLPAGLPYDLFSGKAFVYEKTQEGFILRCHTAKDLSNREFDEYKFKVK